MVCVSCPSTLAYSTCRPPTELRYIKHPVTKKVL